MKIHHTGIIVKDIKKSIEIYRALGYSMSTDIILDDIQHLRICFMKSEDETQTIELIESNGETSSIHNFQTGYHHICYDVSDDTNFISHFKALKIGKIFTQPITAPAIDNRKVVFACLKNGMFVEFLIGEPMIEYRILQEQEMDRELFRTFIRHQAVDQCLRRENGAWVVRSDPFIDDWTEEDYQTLIGCLRNTIRTGGFVLGAFSDGKLKGFTSVENGFFGGENLYYDLSSLHVSEDMRRKGIGKKLFMAAAEWAGKQGAKKLYISSHSAIESQAFYRSLGCVEAAEYNQKHVEAEPYDCQLEYVL